MKAAGVAENNIYACKSGYSNAIENSAIIGVAPEFVYTDGLAVEEVTVKFELDNSIIREHLKTPVQKRKKWYNRNMKAIQIGFFDEENRYKKLTEWLVWKSFRLMLTMRVKC